jgi:N-formylglutamate amidohydrolase
MNRRLYMDEATLEPTAGYAALEADLGRMLASIAAFVRARV